jgi:hypothetical protein
MPLLRLSGLLLLRYAARVYDASLSHDPPRMTRYKSTFVDVHSHTFPAIWNKPKASGCFWPTGWVVSLLLASNHAIYGHPCSHHRRCTNP